MSAPITRDRIQELVFWLAVALVLASALCLGANRPVFWLILAAGSCGLFLVQVGLDLTEPDAPRLWKKIFPAALFYYGAVVWAIIQALPAPFESWAYPAWGDVDFAPVSISADPGATWQGVIRLMCYAALFWIACRGGRDMDRAQKFIRVLALWSTGLAVYGLGSLAIGINPIVGEPAYRGVVTASFINRNAYALYAGIGGLACLSALALQLPPREQKAGHRLLAVRDQLEAIASDGWKYLAGFVVIACALVFTESRAGNAAAVVGAVAFFGLSRARGYRRWRSLVLVAVVLPAAFWLGTSGLGERFLFNDPLDDSRLPVYRQIVVGIETAPWLGHGLGAFQDAFRPYVTAELAGAEWDRAHSSYLENAFELGVPAAVAMMLSLALIAWQIALGARQRRRMRPVAAFAFAVVVAGGLHSIVDFSLQMPATAALFAMILGIGWGQSHRKLNGP